MKPLYAVVDVGGTKLLAAVLNARGEVLGRAKIATEKSSTRALLQQIETQIARAAKKAAVKTSQLRGVALGVPGVVAQGKVTLAPNVPLTGVELERKLGKLLKMPIAIANDGSLGTLGEASFGAARNCASCYGIFVGTGIGGGLVLGGKMFEGARGLGGEIGHLQMPVGDGTLHGLICDRAAGLSDLCSREGMERALRERLKQRRDRSILSEISEGKPDAPLRSGAWKRALQAGEPHVAQIVSNSCALLGLAAASVANIIDPETIVFGGGVIEACGEWMMPQIEMHAKRAALSGDWAPPRIVQSELGDDAILLGGLALLQKRA